MLKSFSNESDVIILTLTFDELNLIKSIPNLATSTSDTYISILDGIVIDPAVNFAQEVTPGAAIPASALIADTTPTCVAQL